MTAKFLEQADIIAAFVPVDMQTANNNGDWVNLQNFSKCVAVLLKAAGTNGDDPVFTIRQAKDNAGTSAKALNITTIWEKVGTLAEHQQVHQGHPGGRCDVHQHRLGRIAGDLRGRGPG
jgi:hypothetical protein